MSEAGQTDLQEATSQGHTASVSASQLPPGRSEVSHTPVWDCATMHADPERGLNVVFGALRAADARVATAFLVLPVTVVMSSAVSQSFITLPPK